MNSRILNRRKKTILFAILIFAVLFGVYLSGTLLSDELIQADLLFWCKFSLPALHYE